MTFYAVRVGPTVAALNATDWLTIYTAEGMALFDLTGKDVADFLNLLRMAHRHMEKTGFGGEEYHDLLDRIIYQGKSTVGPASVHETRSVPDEHPSASDDSQG